jgi:hypothetical protein
MTGASQPEATPDQLAQAAEWLAETPREQRGNAVAELQVRFGLSAVDACHVIRENNLRLARST